MESKGNISFRFNTKRGSDGGITQGASRGVNRQEVLFGGHKIVDPMPRGNFVVINISLYLNSCIIFTFPNCLLHFIPAEKKKKYVVHCILKLLSPMQINLWHKT